MRVCYTGIGARSERRGEARRTTFEEVVWTASADSIVQAEDKLIRLDV